LNGPFIPPEPDKGDPDTIAGYAAVHGRPAAFEGADGVSYSVALESDNTGDPSRPFGAYLLFMRWSGSAEPVVTGHLETDFLALAATPQEAIAAVGGMKLSEVRDVLNRLIDDARPADTSGGERPWWEVMNDEDTES
jgi:hypothetical protein